MSENEQKVMFFGGGIDGPARVGDDGAGRVPLAPPADRTVFLEASRDDAPAAPGENAALERFLTNGPHHLAIRVSARRVLLAVVFDRTINDSPDVRARIVAGCVYTAECSLANFFLTRWRVEPSRETALPLGVPTRGAYVTPRPLGEGSVGSLRVAHEVALQGDVAAATAAAATAAAATAAAATAAAATAVEESAPGADAGRAYFPINNSAAPSLVPRELTNDFSLPQIVGEEPSLSPVASLLDCDERDRPKKNLGNVAVVLGQHPAWAGVFRRNRFTGAIDACRAAPTYVSPVLEDVDLARVQVWLCRAGLDVSIDTVLQGLTVAAEAAAYHPVRDYLLGLEWDGQERDWLVECHRVERSPYTVTIGRQFLIGMVARAFDPGCKLDTMLVLDGDQGLRKSAVLEALGQPWFRDDAIDPEDKDTLLNLSGTWLWEWGELAGIGRRDAQSVKGFLTRRIDKYRAPYARLPAAHPRQVVFAGSVNDDGSGWLQDPTGGRRFLPLPVDYADPVTMRSLRDQYLAEAVVRYRRGEPWWIVDESVLGLARAAQERARVRDEWTDRVLEFVERTTNERGFVTKDSIYEFLQIEQRDRNAGTGRRLSSILHPAGYRRTEARVDGVPVDVYRRKS